MQTYAGEKQKILKIWINSVDNGCQLPTGIRNGRKDYIRNKYLVKNWKTIYYRDYIQNIKIFFKVLNFYRFANTQNYQLRFLNVPLHIFIKYCLPWMVPQMLVYFPQRSQYSHRGRDPSESKRISVRLCWI